jgi:hypothetical protein
MTRESPDDERAVVSGPSAKFDGGAPPGPIDRYIRTPTRLTSVIPCPLGGAAETVAQTTANLLPDVASIGTFVVMVSNTFE